MGKDKEKSLKVISKRKEDPSWRQKENNSQVPTVEFHAQRSLKFKFEFEIYGPG